MRNDTQTRYGTISRALHWVMAFLIGWQALKLADRINDGEHWVGQTLVPWHISIGALLLLLAVLRLMWTWKHRAIRPTQVGPRGRLVHAGHVVLYVVMVLLPITGILRMVGGGYGLEVFGISVMAETGTETGWMASIGNLHSPLAIAFVALIVGHVVAALYHHFIVRDDTLRRML